jgi:hypothetical protein
VDSTETLQGKQQPKQRYNHTKRHNGDTHVNKRNALQVIVSL